MIALDEPKRHIDITGMFMGVYLDNGQPVLYLFQEVFFLPVFSTPEKFYRSLAEARVERSAVKIQIITDGSDFMASVTGKIRLMLDPWHTDRGTTRWTELCLTQDSPLPPSSSPTS